MEKMCPGIFRQAGRRVGALVLGCLIALCNQAATADELTDALIRYAMHDYPRAIEMLTPLAERGEAVAQVKLGLIYTRGEGVARDDVAALGWLTRAAEQGLTEAQFELGVMHRDGVGTPVNGTLAMHWFERAAERGVPHAFNAIGEMYLGHQDVAQDYAAALTWFLRGAQLDDAELTLQRRRPLRSWSGRRAGRNRSIQMVRSCSGCGNRRDTQQSCSCSAGDWRGSHALAGVESKDRRAGLAARSRFCVGIS